MSDYINSTFTVLEDLSNIPSKLDELRKLEGSIKSVVEAKINGSDDLDPSFTKKTIDQEKLDLSIGKILTVLKYAVETDDLVDAITNVEALALEFGNVSNLTDIRAQLIEKKELVKGIALLQKAKTIEDVLVHELDIYGLQQVAKQIEDIHEDDALSHEVIQILNSKVQEKVSAKRASLEPKFRAVLDDCKWLQANNDVDNIPTSTLSSITKAVSDLVDLQAIQNTPIYPESWWALDILLNPIIIRFNYHFNTAHKETNKLSKPEWALNFLEKFLSDHVAILNLIIEDIFKAKNRIATYEVITTLLSPLREKMMNTIKTLNENIARFEGQPLNLEKSGRLLSHFMFELSSFDQRLRNLYKYNPYIETFEEAPSRKWTGLTGDVLLRGNDESLAVSNWLNFEKELANKRFNSEIVHFNEAFKIDFDYQSSFDEEDEEIIKHTLKPTYSSYAMVKLFDNLSSHFQTLSIVKYQLKYVSSIQLDLLDRYFETLNKSYKEFNNAFNQNKVMNLIPGGLKETTKKESDVDAFQIGLKNVEVITEIFCSAKFISNALEQWSEELIFIQLWEAYKSVSKEADSSIFDGSLKQYDQLVNKILVLYEEFFRKEIKAALKNYVNSSQWNIGEKNAETSSELVLLANNIPAYLQFIRKSVSKLNYYLISDKVVSLLSIILTEYIITNNQFSRAGTEQLKSDFGYILQQLRLPLFLETDEDDELSNDSNKHFRRLKQSVEFLYAVDLATAKPYQRKPEKVAELRTKFEDGLAALTNHEISDLLLRIV
ncbi:TIP-1 family-domain-containing protein [Scheffersomyces xylosifermentans]|uniref:TIP-1 family-domain-containing protein n=1 Tax=Scheffersomyces xylosifermentans TaxID=1304137 RepID=UPI00315DE379